MAEKEAKNIDKFSEEYIKKHRTFPKKNVILITVLVVIQIVALVVALNYDPKPQDVIREYNITVEPLDDGSLDIEYSLIWTAIDSSEALTWIEIGVPNPNFTIYRSEIKGNASNVKYNVDEEGYCYAFIELDRAYYGGETLRFSFKINQKDMLCTDGNDFFYEFVPGWFNSTPVEKYRFEWKKSSRDLTSNANERFDDRHVWTGTMECGTYVLMSARYDSSSFKNVSTVDHEEFDDGAIYDALGEDKGAAIAFAVMIIIVLLVFEVTIIDSFVSITCDLLFFKSSNVSSEDLVIKILVFEDLSISLCKISTIEFNSNDTDSQVSTISFKASDECKRASV